MTKVKNTHLLALVAIVSIFVYACNKAKNDEETILTGKISILVDQTIIPIVEDEQLVFQNSYQARITLLPMSEKECINALANKKASVVVLARKLTSEENRFFSKSKIKPRETFFATDAVAVITNIKSNDSLIDPEMIYDVLNGKPSTIAGLVFDNPNSSTMRYIMALANCKTIPQKKVFSFNSNEEVIKYVAQHQGMIGIVGMNWLSQPNTNMLTDVAKIKVLSIKAKNNKYYYPSQENLATKEHPLARDLYIINAQGYEGLGMGFASFIAGEKGQRIVLKSGLAPAKIPGRNIIIK